MSQRADIEPLAAIYFEGKAGSIPLKQPGFMERDGSWVRIDLNATAGEFIHALAVLFQCRVDRRYLHALSPELSLQHSFNLFGRRMLPRRGFVRVGSGIVHRSG